MVNRGLKKKLAMMKSCNYVIDRFAHFSFISDWAINGFNREKKPSEYWQARMFVDRIFILYMWCFERIAPEGNRRLQTNIGQILGKKYDVLRRGKVKIAGKDAIIRVLFKATKLLFDELRQELLK
jgi:hypothetical protein